VGRPRSLDDVFERRRRERELGGDRFVDLRIVFEQHATDLVAADAREEGADDDRIAAIYEDPDPSTEVVHLRGSANATIDVGGRWDRRARDFEGDASSAVVVRFHEGQRAAVEWFCQWLDAHAERRENPPEYDPEAEIVPWAVYSALFAGGRRGGKSWIAVAFAVAYAVRFPTSIVWLVSPSNERHDEIRRYVHEFVAAPWLDDETQDGWELCNGSRLMLKSAFGSGDQLKEGKANFVVLNEGQKMAERAYVVARGAIVDSSGLVLVCANPPVELADKQWVSNFAADAAAHRRASVYLHFNPLLNPFIDRGALLALQAEVDERTFQIEVLGMFLTAKDAVAYNWVRLENEAPRPDSRWDVTEAFMRAIEEGEGIERVIGLDVQRFPYIGGPVYQFFGSPTRDRVLAWIVDEVVLDGGDEEEWCAMLADKGFAPESTLIVCDASGRYQHSRRRSADAPKPEWKGRGSFDIIRSQGYTRIVPPDRRQKRNPEIVDRARAFTSLISTGKGNRRLFADPDRAPRTCQAIREWRTVHGKPSRTQEVAHLGDGASYPIIRIFPRRLRSDGVPGNPRDVGNLVAPVDTRPPSVFDGPDDFMLPPNERRRRGRRDRGL
jgi:hypothetical protein